MPWKGMPSLAVADLRNAVVEPGRCGETTGSVGSLEDRQTVGIVQWADMIAFDCSAEGRAHWGRNLCMIRVEVDGRE